jgi:hypothetical protein
MANVAVPQTGKAVKLFVAGLAAIAAVCCAAAIVTFGASSYGPVSLMALKPVWVKGKEYVPVKVVEHKGTTTQAAEKFLEKEMGHKFTLAAKPLKIVHKRFMHKGYKHPLKTKEHKIFVAQAVPIPGTAHKQAHKQAARKAQHLSHLEAVGKYGHMAEAILTTKHGAVPIQRGHILRGAAPQVSSAASQGHKKSRAEVGFEASTLADALRDCSTDAGDDCNNFLHPDGKSLHAFEQNQDAADAGLFSTFQAAQSIPDARGALPGMVHGGMLAQKPSVDFYGIPNGGSLPGDDV